MQESNLFYINAAINLIPRYARLHINIYYLYRIY